MNRLFRDTLMLFTAAISLIPGPYAFANPTGFNLQAGVVAPPIINGNQMIINQASKAAIINWSSFSIALGESTIFNQPAGGAALNRVTGITPSMIEGTLKANGTIWLINPNGTLIGNTGIIQTGSFLASTLDVSNGEFLNYANGLSDSVNFSGNSGAAIQNLGKVNASEGDVMLFARHVDNKGEIIAPNGDVGLAAGQEITLVRTGEERIQVKPASAGNVGGTGVDNSGNIEAVQAELKANGGNIYALAVNNSGTVKATGAVMKGGKIFLSAGGGKVTNSGSLTASKGTKGGDIHVTGKDVKIASGSKLDASGALGGGTVLVGGDYQGQGTVPTADTTTVEAGASIKADATEKGNGGKVIVWADQDTVFYGNISARGGVAGGNGGFAEVSGKSRLLYSGLADLRAPAGSVGTLLLDPTDLTISNAPDSLNNLSWATIQAQLGLGDMTIDTVLSPDVPGETGTITVTDASPILNTVNDLIFTAAGDFIANGAITNTGAGGLFVTAGGAITINAPVTYAGNISLISGNGGITATGGAITANTLTVETGATGGVLLTTAAHNIATIQTGGAGVGTGGLDFRQARVGGVTVGQIVSAGNVTINDNGPGANITVAGGIVATNSNINLTAGTGMLLINAQINAGSGQVALIGNGGVTQANTGAGITAASLRGESSSGSVLLNPTGIGVADVNTVSTFAGFANVSLSFTNSSGFTIGLVNATQGILTGTGSTTLTVLNAAATISQSAGANGRIDTLTLNVTTDNGSVTLNSVNNNIAALGTINLGAGNLSLVDNIAALSVGAITANGGISITNGGGSLATTADLTTLGSMSLAATGNIGINNNLTASSLSVHSGTDGTGDLSFGAGVTVQANTQSYRAGNGAGGGTAAVANLVTNNPAFRNTAGAAAPVTFTHRQDAAIADANIAAAAQFGGTVPATYTLQSDDASITLATAANVAGSALTLNAATALTISSALNLASLNATGGTGISISGGSVTTTGTQTYNSAVTLAGDTVLTGTTLTLVGGLDGDGNDLTLDFSNAFTLVGGITGVDNFTSEKAINVNGTFTTTGTQLYEGTLTLAGNSELAGTTITTEGTVVGGSHNLLVTGNAVFGNGAADTVTGLGTLQVTGTTLINTNAITTATTQTYGGLVTLGAGTTLTGSSLVLTNNLAGAGNDLTLDFTSVTDINSTLISDVLHFTAEEAVNITGDFATSLTGSQTYNGSVLTAAGITLTGTAVTFNDDLSIAGNAAVGALTVAGDLVFGSASELFVNLNGTGAGQFDQITVTGAGNTVTINAGAALTGSVGASYNVNNALVIIQNNPGLAVTGTFSPSPTLTLNGQNFGYNYAVGPNNVTLTRQATTWIWDGGGANNNWSTANNWTFDANNPGNGDTVQFAGATRLAPSNDLVGIQLNQILFNNGASAFTLGGSGVTLSAGIINNSASLQTVNLPVTLAASQSFTAASGDLSFGSSGTINGAFNLTLDGPEHFTLGGRVGNTAALTQLEANTTVTLAAAGTTGAASVITTGLQTYNQAVTLGANTVLQSTGGGLITFDSTVDGAFALEVNTAGDEVFNGLVGNTTALTSLITDASNVGGAAIFNMDAGTAAADKGGVNAGLVIINDEAEFKVANSTTAKPSVRTTGAQTYNDAVKLMLDTVLVSSGNGNIQFNSTVDTDAAALAVRALTVNTGGVTGFGNGGADNVGGNRALASLTTDAAGSTVFNILGGTSVTTTTTQTYNDAVTLMLDTALASTTAGNISFNSTVDTDALAAAVRSLTVNTAGVTQFGNGGADNVGLDRALLSLTTDAGGSTVFDILGGVHSVLTTETQTYNDAVVLTLDTVLTSDSDPATAGVQVGAAGTNNIQFNSSINSLTGVVADARSLTVNTGGVTGFGNGVGDDRVGGINALLSLTTDDVDSVADGLGAGEERTVFNIDPTVGGFDSSVRTIRTQTYNDAVVLALDTVLTSDSDPATAGVQVGAAGTNNIQFNSSINSLTGVVADARSLTVNTGGVTGFGNGVGDDRVGGINALLSLTTDDVDSVADGLGAGEERTVFNIDPTVGGFDNSVRTSEAQTYNDAVALALDTVLRSTDNGNIQFNSSINSLTDVVADARSLTVNTGGVTGFGNGVGVDRVGGINALLSLTTDDVGAVGEQTVFDINRAGLSSVRTTSHQTYNEKVISIQDIYLDAGGHVTAINSGNDFQEAVRVTANDISLRDVNLLTFGIGTSSAAGSLFAIAESITVNSELEAAVGIALKAGGHLALNNNITAEGGMILESSTFSQAGGTLVSAANLGMRGAAVPVFPQASVGDIAYSGNNFVWISSGTIMIGGAAVSTVAFNGDGIPLSSPSADYVDGLNGINATENVTLTAGVDILQRANADVLIQGTTQLTATNGEIKLENEDNDFVGAVTATAGTNISLRDANSLEVGGMTATNGTVKLHTGGGISQTETGAIIADRLVVTAGGAVLLNKLDGAFGINEVDELGAVNVSGGDFVFFDKGAGLRLMEDVTSSHGVKIVTTGSMRVPSRITIKAGAILKDAGTVVANNQLNDPAGHSLVLVANHNSNAGVIGGDNNLFAPKGMKLEFVGKGVIYVDSQSKSEFGDIQATSFSPNTVYNNDRGNGLNPISFGSGQLTIAIAGRLDVVDLAGQLDTDDILRRIRELSDPSQYVNVDIDEDELRKLRQKLQAQAKRKGGIVTPSSYGGIQLTGFDYMLRSNAEAKKERNEPLTQEEQSDLQISVLQGLPLN